MLGTVNRPAYPPLMMKSPLRLLLLSLVSAASLAGQTPGDIIGTTIPWPFGNIVTQSATIQMGPPPGIIFIVPPPPQPPTTLVAGTHGRFIAHAPGAAHAPVKWFKDGKLLPNAGEALEFPSAGIGDAGRYHCVVTNHEGAAILSDAINVVVSLPGLRLQNASVRARIDPTKPTFLSGFVVQPGPSAMLVLMRAVGPALAQFGVENPLAAPQFQVFDGAGKLVSAGAPWMPVVILPGSVSGARRMLASRAAERVGAFPLPATSSDAADLYFLAPGAYTAQVSSADGGTGEVLLEIYEVPLPL